MAMPDIMIQNLQSLLKDPIFKNAEGSLFVDPWTGHRPINTFFCEDKVWESLQTPLNESSILTPVNDMVQKILRCFYDIDHLVLPDSGHAQDWLDTFYLDRLQTYEGSLRSFLEKYCFSFIMKQPFPSDEMNAHEIDDYICSDLEKNNQGAPSTFRTMMKSSNFQRAFRHFLVRMAPDSYFEGAPLHHATQGHYGLLQTTLFRILKDEMGDKDFSQKHGTLFRNLLTSLGLKEHLHYYWHFYRPTSLLTHNFMQFLSRQKQHFFRYLGMACFGEGTFSTACYYYQEALKTKGFYDVDDRYFNIHKHVDQTHARLCLDMVKHVRDTYHLKCMKVLLRGYEEFKYLVGLTNKDYEDTISFLDAYKPHAQQKGSYEIIEVSSSLLGSHIAPRNISLFNNTSSTLYLFLGLDIQTSLHPGQFIDMKQGTHFIMCRKKNGSHRDVF